MAQISATLYNVIHQTWSQDSAPPRLVCIGQTIEEFTLAGGGATVALINRSCRRIARTPCPNTRAQRRSCLRPAQSCRLNIVLVRSQISTRVIGGAPARFKLHQSTTVARRSSLLSSPQWSQSCRWLANGRTIRIRHQPPDLKARHYFTLPLRRAHRELAIKKN